MTARRSAAAAGRMILLGLCLGGVLVDRAAGQAPSTAAMASTRPVRRRGPTAPQRRAVEAAIKELLKEYRTSQAEGPAAAPRGASDYFLRNPSPLITHEAIVLVLVDPIAGADQSAEAFVKWQLLSGLPAQVGADEWVTKALLLAYRASPPPLARPGMSADEQRDLDRAAQLAKADEAVLLADELDASVQRARKRNEVILMYRDELLARLPDGYDAFRLGFQDALERAHLGADFQAMVRTLIDRVRAWAAVARNREDLAALEKALAEVRAQARGPEYYTEPLWSKSARRLAWKRRSDDLNRGKPLDELARFLREQLAAPEAGGGDVSLAGELDFKDPRLRQTGERRSARRNNRGE